jgi:hypothetical protein
MVGLGPHDWDNTHGVAATVRGAEVNLRGDDHLTDADNDAMPYAIKAVREGVQEIEQAFALGHQGKDVPAVMDSLLGPWEAQSAAEYVHAAEKQSGGPAALTLHQRARLVNKLFFHSYGGERELLLVLTSASDDDARKLIRTFGWERLHGFVDERATPFATRFLRGEYAR